MEKRLLQEISRINELLGNKKLIKEATLGPGDGFIKLIQELLGAGEQQAAKKIEQRAQKELAEMEQAAITDLERMEIANLRQELDDLIQYNSISRQSQQELESKLSKFIKLEDLVDDLFESGTLGADFTKIQRAANTAIESGRKSKDEVIDAFSQILDTKPYFQNNPTIKKGVLDKLEKDLQYIQPKSGPGSLVQVTEKEMAQIVTKMKTEYPELFSTTNGIFKKYPDLAEKAVAKVKNSFEGKSYDELVSFIQREWDFIEKGIKYLPKNSQKSLSDKINNYAKNMKATGKFAVYGTGLAFVISAIVYVLRTLIKNKGNVPKTAGEVVTETVIDVGKGVVDPIKKVATDSTKTIEVNPNTNKTVDWSKYE
jgi:hypothetical protein